MICPNCNSSQKNTIECDNCGIIYFKYNSVKNKKDFLVAKKMYETGNYEEASKMYENLIDRESLSDDLRRDALNSFEDISEKLKGLKKTSSSTSQKRIFSYTLMLFSFMTLCAAIYSSLPYVYFKIGEFYIQGKYVENNTNFGIALLKKSSNRNYSNANLKLTKLYFNGVEVQKDYTSALKYAEMAVKDGHVDAKFILGYLYNFGLGVERNYSKAYYWYNQGAEQGDFKSQYFLGLLYYSGDGVEKNYENAFRWIEKSTHSGNFDDSYLNLGKLYYNGHGTAKDYKMAAKYYQLASDNENAEAKYLLARLYQDGLGVQHDLNKAAELFKKSANGGYKEAIEMSDLYSMDYSGLDQFSSSLNLVSISDVQQISRIVSVEVERLKELRLVNDNIKKNLQPLICELAYIDGLASMASNNNDLSRIFNSMRDELFLILQHCGISESRIENPNIDTDSDIYIGKVKGYLIAISGTFGTILLEDVIKEQDRYSSLDISGFSEGKQIEIKYNLKKRQDAIDIINNQKITTKKIFTEVLSKHRKINYLTKNEITLINKMLMIVN